jgi:hypothetical protein
MAVVGVIGGVMLPQLVLDALLRGAVAENTSIPMREESGGWGWQYRDRPQVCSTSKTLSSTAVTSIDSSPSLAFPPEITRSREESAKSTAKSENVDIGRSRGGDDLRGFDVDAGVVSVSGVARSPGGASPMF